MKTPDTYKQIVDIDADKRLIIDVRDGLLVDAQLFCPRCGGQSGDHQPGCGKPVDQEDTTPQSTPDKLNITLTADHGIIWQYSNPQVSIGREIFIAAD